MPRQRQRARPTTAAAGSAAAAAPSRGASWQAAVAALLVLAGAWYASDLLARRTRSATLAPVPDLSALPPAAQGVIREADAAVRRAPSSAEAVGALGRAYHAALLSTDAIDAYARAEALEPRAWHWTYLRGLLLEERGRLADSRDAFVRVTAVNPAHGLAWFKLGEISFKEGRLDEAERAYLRAGAAPPMPPFTPEGVGTRRVTAVAAYAQLGLARVALDRGRTDEASRILAALTAEYPAFGPARTLRSGLGAQEPVRRLAASRAYVPPADAALDAVIASSPMRDLLLKHAAMAARGGDTEWREFLVRRALRLNRQDPNVLMEAAAMLLATGRAAEALEVLRERETLVPGDHQTLVEQGRCLAELGRLDEAEAVLRRAVRTRDAAAEYNLGTVLDRQGRGEEARAHYDAAIAIDPFHSRALNNLGVWLDRRGRGEEAIAALQRAVAADPENAEAHSNLGSAYIAARRLPDALRSLEEAVALAPESPEAHNNYGIALAQGGRLPEAGAQWEAALRLDPGHPNARRNLGVLQSMRR